MTELKTMLMIAAIVALIMVGLTAYDLYTVYGEPFIVVGEKGEKSILVAFEGDLNIIKYDNGHQKFEFFDSHFKQYNSGFFIRSDGIGIIGVDLGDSFRLNVYTSKGIDTFTAYPQTVKVEPKSSVGADLSKWEYDSVGRNDYVIVIPVDEPKPDRLDILVDMPRTVQYKHDFNWDLVAIDTEIKSEKDRRLENVSIYGKILDPLGLTLKVFDGHTSQFGLFAGDMYIPDNQRLGEYTLKLSASKRGMDSITKTMSFFVIPLDSGSSSSKCPPGIYSWNGTMCVDSNNCTSSHWYNATSQQCVKEVK